jgi:hypothetical protein
VTNKEWLKERVRFENWEQLMKEALVTAKGEVDRRCWRGGRGGVLPRGYDVESVAAEAARMMLNGEARLALGWTWTRIRRELRRVVRRLVEGLHRLKETETTRSEWDGGGASRLAQLGGPKEAVFQDVAGREEELERERVREEFWRALSDAPELVRLARELSQGEPGAEVLASKQSLAGGVT